MSIAIYSAIMVVLVFGLLYIGNKLLERGTNRLVLAVLIVGLVVITMAVSYAAQSVLIRKELVTWL